SGPDTGRGPAAERGPVPYCLEQADLPAEVAVDDVVIDATRGPQVLDGDGDSSPPLQVTAAHRPPRPDLYRDATVPGAEHGTDVTATLIPFGQWGNRGAGAMRVWLPAGGTTPSS